MLNERREMNEIQGVGRDNRFRQGSACRIGITSRWSQGFGRATPFRRR